MLHFCINSTLIFPELSEPHLIPFIPIYLELIQNLL